MPQKQVIIPDPGEFEKKKKEFIKAGKDSFHIVSDFDGTLTKAFMKGKRYHSTFSTIYEGNYLSEDYSKKAYALYSKYYPIEISNNIPLKEKNKKMLEWWKKHLNLMIKCGMSVDVVNNIAKKNKIKLRTGASKFMDLLMKNRIPLLIFSAGVGNLIETYLESEKKLYKNIHLISNFYEFDKNGKVKGFKSKIIHTFNKNEVQVKDTPYYNDIKQRKNVLLLGDNIGDIGVSEGLEHDTIIRIGFLNDNVKELLDDYKKAFDVVILNDGPMDYVNKLVKNILG